jgi:hypothetical protein
MPDGTPARRVLKVREAETVEELRELVERYLNKDEMRDSWWMEARAALYRLTALAAVATEHGIPITHTDPHA